MNRPTLQEALRFVGLTDEIADLEARLNERKRCLRESESRLLGLLEQDGESGIKVGFANGSHATIYHHKSRYLVHKQGEGVTAERLQKEGMAGVRLALDDKRIIRELDQWKENWPERANRILSVVDIGGQVKLRVRRTTTPNAKDQNASETGYD